jgi:hypothetical protein
VRVPILRENADAARILRPSVERISRPLLRAVKYSQLIMATALKLSNAFACLFVGSIGAQRQNPSLQMSRCRAGSPRRTATMIATGRVSDTQQRHRFREECVSIGSAIHVDRSTTTVLTLRVSPGRALSSEPGRRDDRAVEVGARHVAVGLCVAGGVGPFRARWRSKSLLRQVM